MNQQPPSLSFKDKQSSYPPENEETSQTGHFHFTRPLELSRITTGFCLRQPTERIKKELNPKEFHEFQEKFEA